MLLTEPGSNDTARPNQSTTDCAQQRGRVASVEDQTSDLSSASLLTAPTIGATPPLRQLVDAEALWAGLALSIAARRSMRLYVEDTGKYADHATTLQWKSLPAVPAALPIYRDRRTRILVLDLDPTKIPAPSDGAGRAAVERDAARAIELIQRFGGRTVVDRSPRGGMHVYVPLAEEMSLSGLTKVLRLLESTLPTLDIGPMMHPKQGCITPPGGRCKGGGYRELVGTTLVEAVEVFTHRSQPGLIARLNGHLDPQAYLSTGPDQVAAADTDDAPGPVPVSAEPGPRDDDRLPAASTKTLPSWVGPFCADGVVPDRTTRAGKPWTPSEARMAVLELHVARGSSLTDIRTTASAPSWRGFWAGYRDRHDHGRQLVHDWALAWDHARRRLTTIARKSSTSEHKPLQPHTGGDEPAPPILWRKLAIARKWVLTSGKFSGPQIFSALAVANAIAFGIGLSKGSSMAFGTRWISDAAAVSEDTVVSVLQKFRESEGSPIRRLAVWRTDGAQINGDRYTLVEPRLDGRIVRAARWEAIAARPMRVDPVWRKVGLSAWWVHTVLAVIEPGMGDSVQPKELAAAARVSLPTVHRTTRELAAHGLVDYGHGWLARTGRTHRQIPHLTAAADADAVDRRTRHQRQRAEFREFLRLIATNFSSSEIHAYTTLSELADDHEAYMAAVAPGATTSPGPSHGATDTSDDPPDDDDAALALLMQELGGEIIDAGAEPADATAAMALGVGT